MNELFSIVIGKEPPSLDEGPWSDAPAYICYGSAEMEQDLSTGINKADPAKQKCIRTAKAVATFNKGDIALSMTNPKAVVISELSDGMLQTRNYLKIIPSEKLDPWFFVWMINEKADVKKILLKDAAGAPISRVSLQNIKELQNIPLPPLDLQQQLGELYYNRLRMSAEYEKKVKLEEEYTNELIRRAVNEYTDHVRA